MRTDDSGPSIIHDGETYYFCSNRCLEAFGERPTGFADERAQVSDTRTSQGHDYH